MKTTLKTVNATGLREIHEFLAKNHRLDITHFDHPMILAWAYDVEDSMAEGNGAEIELRSRDSLSGCTQTYTISDAGLDVEYVEIE